MPIVTFARPSRCYASDGVTLKQLKHSNYTWQATAANGDRIQLFFYARGNETLLSLCTSKGATRGIFDLYVNGELDSSSYDDYASGDTTEYRYITLTKKIRKGYNVIEIRVNGKNAASSDYVIFVWLASIQ